MNKTYRLVWNALRNIWVAVAEHARGRGKQKAVRLGLAWLSLAGAAVQAAGPAPDTLPIGGQVVAGQATVTQGGASMAITQGSNRAAIDWASFNVGSQAQVNIQQPSANAVLLNRVTGNDASQIFGRINANGQVFLSNPNGVYFAPGASVDVGGLVATTHRIGLDEFMAGNLRFERNGATGSVINEGELKAALGGYIALLAPEVRNQGVIVAQLGTVALAAGEAFELQFDGNRTLAGLRVDAATIRTLVDNRSAVLAPGGLVILSAQAMNSVQGGVVRSGGTVEATGLVERSGRILLDASHQVVVDGGLVSTAAADGRGGNITLTADSVALQGGARLDASGAQGGGRVRVGGGWQGGEGLRQASSVTMAEGSTIDASATRQGDGGSVVLWSDLHRADGRTTANGRILARGAGAGGRGGQVETSGHAVDTSTVQVDAGADAGPGAGPGGLWLIDPYNYTIGSTQAASITSTLNSGTSVTVNTANDDASQGSSGNGSDIGNITLTGAIAKTAGGNATLTLKAHRGVTLSNTSVTASGAGALNLVLWSRAVSSTVDGAVSITGTTINTNGGHLWVGGTDTNPAGITWNGLNVGDGASVTMSNNTAGIYVQGSSINTGAGDMRMRGRTSYTGGGTSGVNRGLQLDVGTTLTTTSGTVDLMGEVRGINNASVGTLIGGTGASGNVQVSTQSGALNISGSNTGQTSSTAYGHGISINSLNSGDQTVVKSDTGAITLDGSTDLTGTVPNDSSGTQLQASATGTTSVKVVSRTGDITIKGASADEVVNQDKINGLRLDAADTGNAIRIGYDGSTAYSGNIRLQSDSIRQHSGNGGSGSISVQGSGSLTIEPVGGSFTYLRSGSPNIFDDDWNFGSALSSFTYGKPSNTAVIRSANAISVAGPISYYGGAIVLYGGLTSTLAGAPMLLKASGNVILGSSLGLQTNNGNLTVWADAAATGGYIGVREGVKFNSAGGSTTQTTGGGAITLAGGTTTDANGLPAGYAFAPSGTGAWGGAPPAGVQLGAFTYNTSGGYSNAIRFNSGGGNIVLRGKAADGAPGIAWYAGSTGATQLIDAGAGTITLDGVGDGAGHGLEMAYYGGPVAPTLQSSSNSATAIRITGVSNSANTAGYQGPLTAVASGTSGISISGTSGANVNWGAVAADTLNLAAASGPIQVTAIGGNGLEIGGAWGKGSLAASSSNITFTADKFLVKPATIVTTGTVTLQPDGSSFSSPLTWPIAGVTLAGTVSGLTLGKPGNTADITLSSATSIAGPISVYGGNINANAHLTSTLAGAPLLLKASGNIVVAAGQTLQTKNGNLTLWADSDANGGYIGVREGVRINSVGGTYAQDSGGGAITLAGGTTTDANGLPTGYAFAPSGAAVWGQNVPSGVQLGAYRFDSGAGYSNDIWIYSGGGNVALRGKAADGAPGISWYGGASGVTQRIYSGSGTLTVDGRGEGAGHGIEFNYLGGPVSPVLSAMGNAVSVLGVSTAGNFSGYKGALTVNLGNPGTILISGTTSAGSTSPAVAATALNLGGPWAEQQVTGIGGTGLDIGGSFGKGPYTGSLSNITLTADNITLGPTIFDTKGMLTLQPHGSSFSNALNWPIAGVTLGSEVSALYLGKVGNTSDITIGSPSTVAGNIFLFGRNLAINAPLTATNGRLGLYGSGNVTEGSSGSVTANELLLNGGNVLLDASANTVNTLAATAVSNLGYTNSGALTLATVGSFSGVSASGAVNIGTHAGDLTVAANLSTTNTTASALTLNAGIDAAAGTASGGNIVVSGSPTVSVGSGGRATLYSGSITGSTGLSTLVGSGSGRFRYGSDETTQAYTLAPTSGLNAIYREQPTVSLALNNASVTYGNTPSATFSLTGGVNGDTAAQAFATLPGTTVGGTMSTGGKPIVGTHTLSAAGTGSTSSQLGYAGSTSGASAATLTVTARTLTATLSGNNKTYDASTAATLTVTDDRVANDALSVVGSGSFADANVGMAKAITVTSTTLSGTDAGNYTLSTAGSPTANITAKSLSITGLAASNKTYDGSTAASMSNWGSVSTGVGSETLVLNHGSASFADANAGVGKTVTASGYSLSSGTGLASNYTLASTSATTTADISRKSLSVSGLAASNKTYDGSSSVTVTNWGGVSTGVGSETLILQHGSASFADANVGVGKTVTASGYSLADDTGLASNYTLASTSATTTADISRKSLSVSGLAASNKTYDGSSSVTVTNWGSVATGVGSETLVLNHGSASFADANAGVGKTVTASGYSLSSGSGLASNYTLASTSATTPADITPKSLTISGLVGANKTYDGSTAASMSNWGSVSTGVGSESLVLHHGSASFADANVGVGKTVTASGYSLADDTGLASNYTLASSSATTTADITPKSLTISGLVGANKTYDGSSAASMSNWGSVSTGVGSETLVLQHGSASFADANAGVGKTVTASGYSLADDSGRAVNYTLASTSATTTADITPKSLTISGLVGVNKAYDGSSAASMSNWGSVSTGVGSETLNLLNGSASFADANAGVGKTVTASGYSLADGSGLASNYTLASSSATTTADITPKSLTISGLIGANKTYDGSSAASMSNWGSVSTGVGSETLVLQHGSASFADANAGVGKTVTASGYSLADGSGLASNYTLASSSATTTADITPKSLSISGLAGANKTYDGGTAASLSNWGSVSTGVGSETLGLLHGSASFADANAGVGKTVTASGYSLADGTGLAANYTLASTSATTTADITPKALGISGLVADNKTYDGSSSASMRNWGSVSTGVGSETLNLVTGSASFADANSGVGKTVTASGYSLADGTGLASNYTLASSSATTTADITPKSLSISGLVGANKTYDGGTAASLSNWGSVATGVGSETLGLLHGSASFADANAGVGKTVTASGYSLADGSGLASNYTLASTSATTTADITPKAVSISGLVAGNKTYDGSSSASMSNWGSVATGVGSETLSLVSSGASASFADAYAGVGKAVTASGYSLADGSGLASNYTLASTSATTTADITPKAVSISGLVAGNKTYDGNTSVLVSHWGSVSTGVGSETVALVAGSASFADANAGVGKTVTASGYSLADGSGLASNYTLASTSATTTANINKAVLTVTANDDAKFLVPQDTPNFAGVRYSGFVNGETAAVLTGSVGVTRSNPSEQMAGNYPNVLVPDTSALGAANYSFQTANGTFNIVPSNQMLVRVTPVNDVYGVNPIYSLASASYYDGSAVQTVMLNNVTQVGNTFTVTDTNAGSATFTVVPLGAARTGAGRLAVGSYALGPTDIRTVNRQNFSDTVTVIGQAVLAPRQLTPSVSNGVSKVYDGNAQMNGVLLTLGGLVAGDQVSTSGSGSFSSANAGSNLGYTVNGLVLTGADAANYVLPGGSSFSGNDGRIAPKALTVSASKVYDGTTALNAGSVTLGGLVGAQTLNYSGATASHAHVADSGKHVNALTLLDGSNGGLAANYLLPTLDAQNAPVTITPAPLQASGVIGGARSKVYDGNTSASGAQVSGSVTGGVAGDTLSLVTDGVTLAYNSAHVASASQIGASGSLGFAIDASSNGSQASDYSLSAAPVAAAAAQITPAPLQASATIGGVLRKVYDGSTSAAGAQVSGSVTGAVAGDSLSLATGGMTLAYNSAHVANASQIGASGSLGFAIVASSNGSQASDYSLTATPVAAVAAQITPLALQASATIGGTLSKVYDGTTAAPGAQVSGHVTGMVAGDTLSLATNGVTLAYNSAHVASATQIGASGSLGFSIDASAVDSQASDYSLAASPVAPVAAQITPAPLTLSASATGSSKVYDGSTAVGGSFAPIFGLLGLLAGDEAAASAASAAYDSKNVGTASRITLSGITLGTVSGNLGSQASDYQLDRSSIDVAGHITPRALTVGLTGGSKVYDGHVQAPVGYSDDRVSGDALSVTGSATFADKNVGHGKTVTATGLTLGGADAGNYVLAANSATTLAEITRLDSVQWIGGNSGNWFDPANWAGGAVPDLSNVANVVIPAGVLVDFNPAGLVAPAEAGTVNIDSLGQQGGLRMGGGTLVVGNGGITLQTVTQNSGTLSTTGAMNLGGLSQTGGSLSAQNGINVSGPYSQTGGGTVATPGTLNINSLGNPGTAVVLGQLNVGALNVNSRGGSITQTTGTGAVVQGDTTLNAGNGDLTLNSPSNRFGGTVNVIGRNVTVVDGDGHLVMGTISAGGTLQLHSPGGRVTRADGSAVPPNRDAASSFALQQLGAVVEAAQALPPPLSALPATISPPAPPLRLEEPAGAGVGQGASAGEGASAGAGAGAGTGTGTGTGTGASPGAGAGDRTGAETNDRTSAGATTSTGAGAGSGAGALPGDRADAATAAPLVTAALAQPTAESGVATLHVLLERLPGASSDGAVRVLVPSVLQASGFEFSLPLALSMALAPSQLLSATQRDGSPLPDWLEFDPATRRFHARAVPGGALPMTVVMSAGGRRAVLLLTPP